MAKYVTFPRRIYRQRRRDFLMRNLGPFSAALGIAIATGAVITWLVDGYLLGLAHAAIVLTYVGMVLLMFLATNHGAIGQLAGAWGEEQTRDVLKKAKRKKLIWTWVDGVATGSGDIDHFVITRQGGLVAIDSKWRNEVDRPRLESDASYATAAARRADQVLRSMKVPVGVIPLVVVWGGIRANVPDHANINGVDFVSGDKLLGWLSGRDGEPVDAPSAQELEQRLLDFRKRVRPGMS